MKPEYLYAMLDVFGKCWVVTDQATQVYSMAALLQEGWVPIRETPFHAATGSAYILVLLERAPEGEMGFGFRNP